MMKKLVYSLVSASLFAITGCDQTQTSDQMMSNQTANAAEHQAAAPADTPAPQETVLAVVNGASITQPVFEVYAAQRKTQKAGQQDSGEEAILEELINLELMRQESVREGLNTQPVIVATLDQQQRTILAGAAIKDYMEKNPVTDAEAEKVYDAQFGTPATEYNARHILVKTREDAEQVIELLDSGSDFEELAKEKSTGPSGASGGKLGWFSPAQMVKPFSEATAKLEPGRYTKEPVETQFGWHVILLEDTRESNPPTFEDVKERLKIFVANQQLQKHIQEIRETAAIEIIAR